MLRRVWSTLVMTALLAAILSLAPAGCRNPASIAPSSTMSATSSTAPVSTTPVAGELIEVVSVRGPLAPINPGGPTVEITLKNVSGQPVLALSAMLYLNQPFSFIFEISSNSPLLPGETASAKRTLIGGGFSDTAFYLMVADGVLGDSQIFSLNKQVQILR